MDRLIYTAMSGANAAIQRQSVLATNLANVSTPGFRSELSTFRSVPLEGEGASTRVFALETTAGYADAPGPAQSKLWCHLGCILRQSHRHCRCKLVHSK